jgi:hypothetical protein
VRIIDNINNPKHTENSFEYLHLKGCRKSEQHWYQMLNKGRLIKGHCRSNPKNLPEYKSYTYNSK